MKKISPSTSRAKKIAQLRVEFLFMVVRVRPKPSLQNKRHIIALLYPL
jgi:hypothetical protein